MVQKWTNTMDIPVRVVMYNLLAMYIAIGE